MEVAVRDSHLVAARIARMGYSETIRATTSVGHLVDGDGQDDYFGGVPDPPPDGPDAGA